MPNLTHYISSLDGNGRLGWLFVPLFMWQMDRIKSLTFCISAFFEAHRDEDHDRLGAVSRDDDWTGWCRFFLRVVQSQVEENQNKATAILGLYESMNPL
ncbi:hypothetical protein NKDENANG_03236 [Candidatus Entotheonellaceae bacterium PAL068K]